jgi:hypothetical protein
VPCDPNDDLAAVMAIPVCTFNYKDRPSSKAIHEGKTHGFIAQDVEKHAPHAVKTIRKAVPSILTYGTLHSSLEVCLPLDVMLHAGDSIKLIYGNVDIIRKVVSCTKDTICIDNEIHIVNDDTSIYVYGHVVNDFKLINTEALMPLVFNSVKALHSQLRSQSQMMEDILRRLERLET